MSGMCERCDDDVDEVNLEAFELTGEILCAGCAQEAFDELAEADHG